MKSAYLELALRFPSGRSPDGDDESRDRQSFRRSEVDAAWAVLRNPAARARYDDLLSSGERDGVAGTASHPAASATRVTVATSRGVEMAPMAPADRYRARQANPFAEDPEAADLDPESDPLPAEAPRWTRWAPLIIGGIVLVLILTWAALAQKKDDPGVKLLTVQQFGIDTCVALVPEEASGTPVSGQRGTEFAVSVSCEGAHEYTIIDRIEFPRPCPRGQALVLLAEKQVLCVVKR